MAGQPPTVAAPANIGLQRHETFGQNCPARPFQNSCPTESVRDNRGLLLVQATKFWGDMLCSTDNCNTLRLAQVSSASAKPTWLSLG